jgi:hypothetical protein
MNAARSSALHQRNRLLLQTAPLRTAAQSRRVLTTSVPVASPSSSLPSSGHGHGHGHGKAFNSSLAVESTIARSDPAEFATINQFETSQMFLKPISPIKQHEKLVQSGVLRSDDHQIRIIGKLQRFWEQVLQYNPPPIPEAKTSDSLVIIFHSHPRTADPFAVRFLVCFLVHLQYRKLRLLRRQKVFTFMVTLAQARRCLWTSFTKHCPLPSHASVVCTSTPS